MKTEKMRFEAATAMMQALVSNPEWDTCNWETIAGAAVDAADCLLEALAKYPPAEKSLPTDTDGWIAHRPGDPMPCDHDLMVCVRFIDGEEDEGDHDAGFWKGVDGSVSFWDENGFETIIAWKPAKKS
jgi:hypothetical protein